MSGDHSKKKSILKFPWSSGDKSKNKTSPKSVESSGDPSKDKPSPKSVESSGDPSKDKPRPESVESSGEPSKDKPSPKSVGTSGDSSKDKPSPKSVGYSGDPRKDKQSSKPGGSSGDPRKDKPSPKPVGSSGDPSKDKPRPKPESSKDKPSPKPVGSSGEPSKDKPSPKPPCSSGDPSKDKPSPKSVGSSGYQNVTVDKDKPDTKPDLSESSSLLQRRNSSSHATTSSSVASAPGVSTTRRRTNSVTWASNVATTMDKAHSTEKPTTSTSAGLTTSASQSSGTAGRPAVSVQTASTGISDSSSSGDGEARYPSAFSGPRLTVVTKFGNICPSGKVELQIPKYVEPMSKKILREVPSKAGYGYGSIVAGPCQMKSKGSRRGNKDPEQLTLSGHEHYKKGRFTDALVQLTEALSLRPNSAVILTKRASTLMELKLCAEALADCAKAIQLEPLSAPAHFLMASINLRLGRLETAREYHFKTARSPDHAGLQKIHNVVKHVEICKEARSKADWRQTLREVNAAIAAGADSCFWLYTAKAEALYRLNQLDEADSSLASSSEFECQFPPSSDEQSFGMLSHSYFYLVKARVDLAQGRYDEARSAAEKSKEIDPNNMLAPLFLDKVKLVSTARILGNELYTSGQFAEACEAYSNGLLYDSSHPTLLYNRAACRFHLGQLAKSLVDCNKALEFKPNYYKALRQRAEIYTKLDQWEEAVRDYDVLRKAFQKDKTIADCFSQAELSLKASRGKKVSDTNSGRQIKLLCTREEILEAKTEYGVSVFYFTKFDDMRCEVSTPFVNVLCFNHPSVKFYKVNIDKSRHIAKEEKVRFVPVFHLYKNGTDAKRLVCPSESILDAAIRDLISQEM